MQVISMMGYYAISSAMILAPVYYILNKYIFQNRDRTIAYFVFSVYLCGVYSIVGLPDILYVRFSPHFNFTPFAYMFSDFRSSFLNVLLFFPLGFFLPVLWPEYRKAWHTLVFGFLVSAAIEILQIFTLRATDINDLMTNTAGTLIGWIAGRFLLYGRKAFIVGGTRQDIRWILAASIATMFFLHPVFEKLLRLIF